MNKPIKFVIVSGIGFIIDFIIYNILSYLTPLNVDFCNMISSLVGVTFVFFTSTKRIFENNTTNISLKYKYLIYVVYQIILILLASKVLLLMNDGLSSIDIKLIQNFSKLLSKCLITPFTLTINYFVMKKLTKI